MKRAISILVPLIFTINAFAQPNLTKSRVIRLYGGSDDAFERAGADAEDRAFPGEGIGFAQQQGAFTAFVSVSKRPGGKKNNWQELGPIRPNVVGPATYTGRPTTD